MSDRLIACLSRSFLKLTGRALPGLVDVAAAFNAPFVLLAHGTEVSRREKVVTFDPTIPAILHPTLLIARRIPGSVMAMQLH